MRFRKIVPGWMKKEKSASAQEVLDRLKEFLESADVTKEPVEILCRFWEDQQAVITYQELREAVKKGELNKEIWEQWSQDYSYLVQTQLKDLWTKAIQIGAVSQPLVETIASGFTFHTQTPGILSWISQRGAEFVTSCTKQQKDAIAVLLSKKMIENHTVDELAQMIRPCIGLTEVQTKANARYYDSIVANLKEKFPKMRTKTIQKKAQEAANKYAERQHRGRAMTIARTECAFAYNRGADEGIRQAQAQNLIGKIKKRWSTAGDDAVCKICADLDGEEIGMDADFSLKGEPLFTSQHGLPPAHPNCGCAVEYIEIEPPNRMEGNLSANENDSKIFPEHDPPKYIGSLADMSEDMVQSTLEKFGAELAESEIENAVVISKSGLIWQCFGKKNAVYPNADLGEELRKAYVIHNHPITETHFSLSYDDISLFMDYELSQLTGIDNEYVYTIRRTAETKYAEMEELQHAYKGENYVAFMEAILYGSVDADFDEYDFYVRRLAERYGFQYERKKR